MDIYKQQLLEPLTVFQIFSVLLWVLDEYWQYPLFTLSMILMFEGVTVMSRLKNMGTLRGMGNSSLEIQVFRFNKWMPLSTDMLVPGDLFSLKRNEVGESVAPCDGLVLHGCAVMNEATLTGESIPQMKEGMGSILDESDMKVNLDMKSLHKVHTLYGGTIMMQHDAQVETHVVGRPKTPDDGVLVYCLRTGFNASQGKMVRMIEFSSGKVTGSTRDALGLALLLLIFAIISSSYVLHDGIKSKGKVTFELLLRCVLIITSVIPAELPMQTALAVNTALLTLVKKAIFCTEPFRISLAGKVDICLFDKTGTLTTDQLTAIGIASYEPSSTDTVPDVVPDATNPISMIACNLDSALVLAGCHSLVQINGKSVGDPVEEASLRAIDFTYNPTTKTSKPKSVADSEKAHLRTWKNVELSRVSVTVLRRHHFASKLQRMSVVCKVNDGRGKTELRSLVKGSPEAIGKLLSKKTGCKPEWYERVYQDMARQGMRVLALATKTLTNVNESDISHMPRTMAESDLRFVGFAAFRCLVRKDSAAVLKQLKDSSHLITMITGDAVLTAVHVAKEVAITTREPLILTETGSKEDDDSLVLAWTSAIDDRVVKPYEGTPITILATEYDLCVSGSALQASLSVNNDLWEALPYIRVYARMTPELKERVMVTLKKQGHHTLMCGDGANDVGALKQADIGVALLSGFGSANAGKGDAGANPNKLRSKFQKTRQVDKVALAALSVSELKKRLTTLKIIFTQCREKKELVDLLAKAEALLPAETPTSLAKAKIKAKNAPLSAAEKAARVQKKQAEIEADVIERTQKGESFPRIRALAAFAKREAEEAKAKSKERSGTSGFANAATNAAMANYMDDFEDGDLPMVKLGDASIASPFTSRAPSIQATVDIIRQGRCALVTTMQMYQILAVNCLISSYSLSVLYLDKVKYGNAQMITLGMIGTVSSLTLSRATPLDKLSPVRPLTSIFHPALFASLVGQFVLHLGCMVLCTQLAKEYSVHEPERTGKEFVPNILSTVVFLINGVQTVSVCAINYKGRPFMKGMVDNPGLLYSLGASFIGVFMLATEVMPLFNKTLEIVPLPDPLFTRKLLFYLTVDIFGSFVWDQLCLLMFAPHILKACLSECTSNDFKKLAKMGIIILIIIYIFSNVDYEELERQQKILEDAAAVVEETMPDNATLSS